MSINDSLFTMKNVCFRYGRTLALDAIHMDSPDARIIGLIGRNGSGKTTLFHHLLGILLPQEGDVRVLGQSSAELGDNELSRIGWVPQEPRFLDWMKVPRHLDWIASYYPDWSASRAEHWMKQLEVPLTQKVGELSPGDRQKLASIVAVASSPRLLLLDEPTSAMDPVSREAWMSLLLELVQDDEELQVIISSHNLSDIEKLVDWILFLDKGKLTRNASLDDLKESMGSSLEGIFRLLAKTSSDLPV